MLEPKDTNIWALLLVFVLLPLVSYLLLGKWIETMKRKKRISQIVVRAAEETHLVEDMAATCVIPTVGAPNNSLHQCARCFGIATTRCSQCKSVWYCSGRCQITHWRQIHKLECLQMGNNHQISSPKPNSLEGSCKRVSLENMSERNLFERNGKHPNLEKISSNDFSPLNPLKTMDRLGEHFTDYGPISQTHVLLNEDNDPEAMLSENGVVGRQSETVSDNVFNWSSRSSAEINGLNVSNIRVNLVNGECVPRKVINSCSETKGLNCSLGKASSKRCNKPRIATHSRGAKSPTLAKSGVKMCENIENEPSSAMLKDNSHLQRSNGVGSLGMSKTVQSVKLENQQQLEQNTKKPPKVKMLFPYEEFVKCFQFEACNLLPRGLVNCGNSCYANAVLQCLTFTKPLIIYLLRQSHSNAGCTKNWCLLCELERHVMMLRESGNPLSPGNILMHIRSLNSQIGNGSQEDAHEFLRFIIASMQSICLESLGGEHVVDPKLQDTTFVQHMFGGQIRSKVKCLKCHQESERNENIMDLTLEIFGSVNSLEDALTHFTNPEDLDGENMYRCGRCSSYVRAQKQLSIKEAPNILTIVLKRFQEKGYGKINKCVRFPETLNMIPFMTGTDDSPPLYHLYAVVVHLDTANASFSGHYISYVKDLRGFWFKVDDTEVQPVQLNQVMSEEAYILFYMRSYPRPATGRTRKATSQHSVAVPKNCGCSSKTEKSPKSGQSKVSRIVSRRNPYLDHRLETNSAYMDSCRGSFVRENRSRSQSSTNYSEFSDAASSDWSLFTSSDDASFTTESTRDSLSAIDYSDVIPFASIFQSLYSADSASHLDICHRQDLLTN